MTTSFVIIRGRMHKEGEVIHIVAESFVDLSSKLSAMRAEDARPLQLRQSVHGALIRSRDFH